MTTEFVALGLRPELTQTLTEKEYQTPTPIQSELIPAMLAGRDVIGQSQTGTGKTAAFALPILNSLKPRHRHIQSLIVAPTRELAIQVTEAMAQYGKRVGVRMLSVYGGQAYSTQINALKRGVDVVVGTPGRLLDLLEREALDLGGVSTVVLDEADEMLGMGFIDDIEAILSATPAQRQTALFSATMPEPILRLAARYLREPHTYTMGRRHVTVAAIEQRGYLIHEADRLAALTRLFEVEPIVSALVFARTRARTTELTDELNARGFAAEVLNGDLGQEARERVIQRFRNNQIKVLVATDVAARGLDIQHVSHVFNFELPQDPEVYVHRIGRTGRAGKSGVAISLITPKERWFLRKLEAYTKQKIALGDLPTVEQIQQQRDARLVEQLMVWLKRGRCHSERNMVQTVSEQGFEMAEIAAAALKLVRTEEKQRPIAAISEVRPDQPVKAKATSKHAQRGKAKSAENTSHEPGMVRLSLNRGSADGLNVSHIVGSLSHHADIPGRCIGKILIGDQTTLVDVPEAMLSQVLAKKETYRIGRKRTSIERA
ncbi:MAG: DEAD/DEAH box helicase [Desulfobacteraceae bacterium]|nr:DEAD/DEAH box helicase [Desulfobacteraceae bacterium]